MLTSLANLFVNPNKAHRLRNRIKTKPKKRCKHAQKQSHRTEFKRIRMNPAGWHTRGGGG